MINKNVKTFIGLVKAGLCEGKAEVPSDFDLEGFYTLAKKHQIMNLCFNGASLSGMDLNTEPMQKLYRGALAEHIFHEKQTKALKELFSVFEENQISYMPLKGSVIKELYKKPELRNMVDADILIKLEEYPKIKEAMVSLGFEFIKESDNEIVWKKQGLLSVELHKALLPSYVEEFYSFFKDAWAVALKDKTEYRYKMSNEDEFIYTFVHFAKHYKLGGIGIRPLCDLWVLLNERELDFSLLEEKLQKLSLTEFYENVKNTLNFWFADREADEKVLLITKTILKSGAFGTRSSSQNAFALRLATENQALAGKKFRVLMFKIFPNSKFIKHKYPFLEKHRWLLPLAWGMRWFDAVFVNRRKIKNGINAIKNTDDERARQIEKDFLAVGLSFNFTEE